MPDNWSEAVLEALDNLLVMTLDYLPNLLGATLVLIAGLVIAGLAKKLVIKLLRLLKVDRALEVSGIESALEKQDIRFDGPQIVGALVKWFIVIAILIAVFDILGLVAVNAFLTEILAYLPNVVAALLILLVASVLAEFVRKLIVGAATAANVKTAPFLGTVAKSAIWVFAILAAINQLGIASELVQILFSGIVFGTALALGLSFGLGGRQAASSLIEKVSKDSAPRS